MELCDFSLVNWLHSSILGCNRSNQLSKTSLQPIGTPNFNQNSIRLQIMRRNAFNSKMHLNNMVYRILNEKMYKSAIFSKNQEIRLVLGIFCATMQFLRAGLMP